MRKAIFGLLLPVVLVAALGVACGGGGHQTVQGNVASVEYERLSARVFGFKAGDMGPVTLVIVQDENKERYFLAAWGHDPALKRGQQVEITFDKGDTVVETDLTIYIEDEDGKIISSELAENTKFKKIISYTILDSKK